MEVKIGVQYAHRELVLESAESPEEITETVEEALRSEQSTLSLVDERGRRVIIPTSKLAYVEIAGQTPRGVGFTAGT